MQTLINKTEEVEISKTGSQLNTLNSSFENQPVEIERKKVELSNRVAKLTEINSTILGRMSLSKSDKEMLIIEQKNNLEALEIIKAGESKSLMAIADYQIRYLKTVLHNLVIVGESNVTAASKIHYESIKQFLQSRLLVKMEEMYNFLEDFELRAAGKPKKFQDALMAASDRTRQQYLIDFDLHITDFAELLKKTFTK